MADCERSTVAVEGREWPVSLLVETLQAFARGHGAKIRGLVTKGQATELVAALADSTVGQVNGLADGAILRVGEVQFYESADVPLADEKERRVLCQLECVEHSANGGPMPSPKKKGRAKKTEPAAPLPEVVRAEPAGELAPLIDVATEVSLDLPVALTLEQYAGVCHAIGRAHKGSMWYLGDAGVYGESHFGEDYAQHFDPRAMGYEPEVAANAKYVCKRFPPERRRADLSFSHHAAVAALAPEKADSWLERAAKEGWIVAQLREAIAQVRELVQAENPKPRRGRPPKARAEAAQPEPSKQEPLKEEEPKVAGKLSLKKKEPEAAAAPASAAAQLQEYARKLAGMEPEGVVAEYSQAIAVTSEHLMGFAQHLQDCQGEASNDEITQEAVQKLRAISKVIVADLLRLDTTAARIEELME